MKSAIISEINSTVSLDVQITNNAVMVLLKSDKDWDRSSLAMSITTLELVKETLLKKYKGLVGFKE